MSSSQISHKAETQGSSLAFVKPLPKRDEALTGRDSSSSERPGAPSAADLWPQAGTSSTHGDQNGASLIGCQLGHFSIEERIGYGGMGAVFRATDTRLDRVVALKVLSPAQSEDQNSIERFRNEARAAARMDHENIARVYYVGIEQGLSFIAFEFVHGSNVRQLIEQQGALTPADALNYSLQVASALRQTDAAGVVHRDIKPSNIIITPSRRAKLVDLGLARKRDPQASSDLTVDGTTLGTFDYISPEQAKDPRTVDIRSDIYSLGCTLFHMLTGEPPYPAGTMLQKLLDHQGKEIPDAASLNPGVPQDLSDVVRKMMASDPRDRYASADLLIDDLSVIAHRFGLRPVAADGVIWSRPRGREGWDLWRQYGGWLVAAACLLMIVFMVDWFSNAPRQELNSPAFRKSQTDAGDPREQEHRSSRQVAGNENTNSDRAGTPPAGSSGVPQSPAPVDPQENASSNESDIVAPRTFISLMGELLSGLPAENERSSSSSPATEHVTENAEAPSASEDAFTTADTTGDDQQLAEADTPLPAAEAELPVAATDPFVVIVNGMPQGSYPTLQAACAEAPDNAFVELHYDGVPQTVQQPLRITGKRLRLRAAKGVRPTLRFALPEGRVLAGREPFVRMLSVSMGSLEIYNIDLTVQVDPGANIGQWIVLSLSEVDNLELHGVSITLENETRRPAALIEVTEAVQPAYAEDVPPTVKINADDCFFRGEGDLFLVKNADSSRFRLSNVAVALDGSLLWLEGNDKYPMATDMTSGHDVELELNHVTALLGASVASFDLQSTDAVPRLFVDASDCVISTSAPLIDMQGDLQRRDFEERLVWSDNATYLEGPSPVWQISTFMKTWEYDRDEFDDFWERSGYAAQPRSNRTLLPDPSGRRFSEMNRLDLQLEGTAATNPAFGGASDGTNAGIDWNAEKLPRLHSKDDLSAVPSDRLSTAASS